MFPLNITLLLFYGFPKKIIAIYDKTENQMSYIQMHYRIFIYLFNYTDMSFLSL